MIETKINSNVTKRVSDDGKINYWKKIKYNMNWYYTKLSENVYEQMGLKHVKNEKRIESRNMYLVTEDIQQDSEMHFGNSITQNNQLSLIKEDLKSFLTNKGITEENIHGVWDDFLKMVLADICTSNPDRHGQNWAVLIKDNVANLAPNFDYDYTFSQNEYAMKEIANAVENKEKTVVNRITQKYNVNKFTGYLKNTIEHIGLEIGEGRKFLIDMTTEKYSFKETSKYIQKELGQKEYSNLLNKVNIQEASPKTDNKDYEVYSLLAQMHNVSIREKITEPNIDDQER